jgi:hypothetical protein
MRQQRKSGRDNVYSKGQKTEKLNHTHANPVTRGLVEHPDLAMELLVAL